MDSDTGFLSCFKFDSSNCEPQTRQTQTQTRITRITQQTQQSKNDVIKQIRACSVFSGISPTLSKILAEREFQIFLSDKSISFYLRDLFHNVNDVNDIRVS